VRNYRGEITEGEIIAGRITVGGIKEEVVREIERLLDREEIIEMGIM
jgi:RNA-binding protein YhbY